MEGKRSTWIETKRSKECIYLHDADRNMHGMLYGSTFFFRRDAAETWMMVTGGWARDQNFRNKEEWDAPEAELEPLRRTQETAEKEFDQLRIEMLKREGEKPEPTESQADAFKPLLGTWSLAEQILNPHHFKNQRGNEYDRYDLTFSKNKHGGHSARLVTEMEGGLRSENYRVTLNSNASPKEINIFGEGFLIQGNYECEGDTLKIAYLGKPEIGRPSTLEPTPKSPPSHGVWVYRRNDKPNADAIGAALSEEYPEASDRPMQRVNYRGVCIGRDGGGFITDATVRLFLYRGSDASFVLAKVATTDERGFFSIRGRVSKEFDLTVSRIAISAPGRATSVLSYQDTGKAFPAIRLSEPASVTGKVIDWESRPVDGALVILGYLPGIWQARTDVDGRFEIADVPPAKKNRMGSFNDLLMAVHPEQEEILATTTIKSVPADVQIRLENIPNIPSPLARAADDALTYRTGIEGDWRMTSQLLSPDHLKIPPEEFDAADVRWSFDESQMSLQLLDTHWSGDRVTRSQRSDKVAQHYKLLPKGKIVLEKIDDGKLVKEVAGKYRIRGDRLWVALPSGDGRPVNTAANATGDEQQKGVDYFAFERVDPVRMKAPAENLFFDEKVSE